MIYFLFLQHYHSGENHDHLSHGNEAVTIEVKPDFEFYIFCRKVSRHDEIDGSITNVRKKYVCLWGMHKQGKQSNIQQKFANF